MIINNRFVIFEDTNDFINALNFKFCSPLINLYFIQFPKGVQFMGKMNVETPLVNLTYVDYGCITREPNVAYYMMTT